MRILSQYDAKMYRDELAGLQEEMADILIEMEHRKDSSSGEAFLAWWDDGGAMRHYFDLKGRAERIEQILQYSVIEEEQHPKMRGGDSLMRRRSPGSGEDR